MTKYTKELTSAKKGMETLSWILVIGFFVAISALIITWTQSHGKAMTEETVNYVEGRMDCESISIANISQNCQTNTVELKNIGTLNIVKISAQLDDKESKSLDLDLKAQGASQTLSIGKSFKKAKLIPITKSNNNLVGCKEKSITIYCPP